MSRLQTPESGTHMATPANYGAFANDLPCWQTKNGPQAFRNQLNAQ
jgi:hypothetical protein